MSVRQFVIVAGIAILSCGILVNASSAQEPQAGKRDSAMDRLSLFESLEEPDVATSPSDQRTTRMTAAELRQARALYRANQRTARLEYNLWMGYEPLRPKFNAIPMMSSRYAPRRIYTPVYVWPR